MSAISGDPDEFHTKAFTFHTVNTSRTGYVKNSSTMQEIKLAAKEYVKGDIHDRNRQEFTNAKIFICENTTIPVEFSEPKDKVKAKALGTDTSARGIVFVPACNSTQQDQPPNNAPVPAAGVDVLAEVTNRINALITANHKEVEGLKEDYRQQIDALKEDSRKEIEGLKEDNRKEIEGLKEDNRKEIEGLKEDNRKEIEGLKEDNRKEIEGLKEDNRKETEGLKEDSNRKMGEALARIEEVEKTSGDMIGWLITSDPQSMDKLRLRHILDYGQARLARLSNLPVTHPQNVGMLSRAWRAHFSDCLDNDERLARARILLEGCGDNETINLSDEVLHLFVDFPSSIRTDEDAVAHPVSTSNRVYRDLIARQAVDRKAPLWDFVMYGSKFSP